MAYSRNEDGPDERVRHAGHVKKSKKIIGKNKFPAADRYCMLIKLKQKKNKYYLISEN